MSSKSINLIISLTRSGSNWLSYILGSSSDSAHLGEYHRPFSSHGHIACRLCEANGFSECKYLYGINNVDKSNAFKFAFDRFQVKYF